MSFSQEKKPDIVIQHFLNRMQQPHFLEIQRRYENAENLGDDWQAILEFGCATNKYDLVDMLLNKYPPPASGERAYAIDPTVNCMNYAIANGNLAIVDRLLMDKRISPVLSTPPIDGSNGAVFYHIVMAAHKGDPAIFRTLLADRRTDPTADENHAMHVAIEDGHAEIVEILLQDGRTPLTESMFRRARTFPNVLAALEREQSLRVAYLQAMFKDNAAEKMFEIERDAPNFNPAFENGIAMTVAVVRNLPGALTYLLTKISFSPEGNDNALLKKAAEISAAESFEVLANHFLVRYQAAPGEIDNLRRQIQLQRASSMQNGSKS